MALVAKHVATPLPSTTLAQFITWPALLHTFAIVVGASRLDTVAVPRAAIWNHGPFHVYRHFPSIDLALSARESFSTFFSRPRSFPVDIKFSLHQILSDFDNVML